jgi:hypothetical protein
MITETSCTYTMRNLHDHGPEAGAASFGVAEVGFLGMEGSGHSQGFLKARRSDRPDQARAWLQALTGDSLSQVLTDQLEAASGHARRQPLTWVQTDGTVTLPALES